VPGGQRVGLLGEQQADPGLLHVPLDVLREHAEEDVRAHSVFGAVEDRADFEARHLHHAEGLLDPGEALVVPDGVIGVDGLLRHAGAHDVDAIERGLGLHAVLAYGESQLVVLDHDLEVLGHVRAANSEGRVATGHEALAGVPRRLDLEEPALVEEVHLQCAILVEPADGARLQGGDLLDATSVLQVLDDRLSEHAAVDDEHQEMHLPGLSILSAKS
jgi:hypothetical protein